MLVLAVGVNSQQGKIGLLLQQGGGGGDGSTMPMEVAAGAGVTVAQQGAATPQAAGLGKTSFLTEKLDVLARQIG